MNQTTDFPQTDLTIGSAFASTQAETALRVSGRNTMPYLQRRCPSCESSSIVGKVAARRPAETLPFETLQDHWRGFFKDNVFFTYFRCAGCGLLYCPSFFDGQQLTTLYGSMPDNTAGVNQVVVRKTQEGYFRLLEKYSDLKGTMLELGPDIGLFTEFCRKEGKFERFWMFEPNRAVHAELARRLEGVPTTISPEFFSFEEVPDHSVDVAVMIHVLDHLLDPKDSLAKLRAKLRPGARLLIVTHDESSLLARVVRNRWPAYCLQHPHLFNPNSIRKFLASAGFETVQIERTVNHFPVTFLLQHLLFAFRIKKVPLPSLPWLQLPLKLGNICTIARIPN